MRRLVSKIAESKVLVIFINHAISTTSGYGDQSTSAGGHAIKFYSSVRINFSGNATIKEKEKRIGQRVYLTVKKLKGAKLTDFRFQADLLNDTGFDTANSLLDAMMETGLVTLSGKTYTLKREEPIEFQKSQWKDVLLEAFGGTNEAYKSWLDWGLENEVIRPWGSFGTASH
jgi:recombination protein RecA